MATTSVQITDLLRAWASGNEAALEQLTPLVYHELRCIARKHMRREHPDNLLQTTVLVNEAFVRLLETAAVNWKDRVHFFAVSAKVMRRILVDAARARAAAKRIGKPQGSPRFSARNLLEIPDPLSKRGSELLAVDDALSTLSQIDSRKARVVELRFFGGLNVEETAEVLGVSPQTVLRDWRLARAWLMRELTR